MTSWLLCILIRLCSLYSVFMYDGSSEHFDEGMGYSKEILSKVRDGYGIFSVFLESLFTCIASMHDEWVEQLIHQVMPAVETLLPELDVNNLGMPQPLLTAITEMPKALVRKPIHELKNMFRRSAIIIKKRPNSISNDLNEVLNFLDTIYKIKKGQNISQDLEDFNGYPTIIRTPDKLVRDTIKDVVIYPFLSLKPAEQRYLIMSLNRVLESDYSIQLMLPLFTTRRRYLPVKTTVPLYQGSYNPLRHKTLHYKKQKSEQNKYSNNPPETNPESLIILERSKVLHSTSKKDIKKIANKTVYRGYQVPSNLMGFKKDNSRTKFIDGQKTSLNRNHNILVKESSIYLKANKDSKNKRHVNKDILPARYNTQFNRNQKSKYNTYPNRNDTENMQEDYYFLKSSDDVNTKKLRRMKKKSENKVIPERLLPSNLVPYNKNKQKHLHTTLRQRKLKSSKDEKDNNRYVKYIEQKSARKKGLVRKTFKESTFTNRIKHRFYKRDALRNSSLLYRVTTLLSPRASDFKSKRVNDITLKDNLRNKTPLKKRHFLFIFSDEVGDLITNSFKYNMAQIHEILPKVPINNNNTEKQTKIVPVDEIKFLIGNKSRTVYVETSGHKKQIPGINTDIVNLPLVIEQNNLLTTSVSPLNIQEPIFNIDSEILSSEEYSFRYKMSPFNHFTNQMYPNNYSPKSDRINKHITTPAHVSTEPTYNMAISSNSITNVKLDQNIKAWPMIDLQLSSNEKLPLKKKKLKSKNHQQRHFHGSLHKEIQHVKINHPEIYKKYIEGHTKHHKLKSRNLNYLRTSEEIINLRKNYNIRWDSFQKGDSNKHDRKANTFFEKPVLRRQFSSIKPFVQKYKLTKSVPEYTENDVSYSYIEYRDNSSQESEVTETVNHNIQDSKATQTSLEYYWTRTNKADSSNKIVKTNSPLKEKHNYGDISYESYADTSFEVKLSNQLVKKHQVNSENEMTEHSTSEPEISHIEEKRDGNSPKLRAQSYSTIKPTTIAIPRENTTVKTKLKETLRQNNYNYLENSSVTSFEMTYKEVQSETTQFSLNRNESKPTPQITKSSLQETEKVSSQNITENTLPLIHSNLNNIMMHQGIVETNDTLSNTNKKLNSNQISVNYNQKLTSNNIKQNSKQIEYSNNFPVTNQEIQLVKERSVIGKIEMTGHSTFELGISQTEEKHNTNSPKLRTQRYSTIEPTKIAMPKENTTVKTKLKQALRQNNYNNLGSSSVSNFEMIYKEVQSETTHFSLNGNESKPTPQITKSSLQETESVSSHSVTENALPLKLSSLNIIMRQSIGETNNILSDTNEKLSSNKTLLYSFKKLSPKNRKKKAHKNKYSNDFPDTNQENQLIKEHSVIGKNEMTEHSKSEPEISQTEEKRNGNNSKLITLRFSSIEPTTIAIPRENTNVKTKLKETVRQNENNFFGNSSVTSIEMTNKEVQSETIQFLLNRNESKPTPQITKSSLQERETERVSSQNDTENALPLKFSSQNIMMHQGIVETNDKLSGTNEKLYSNKTLVYSIQELSHNNRKDKSQQNEYSNNLETNQENLSVKENSVIGKNEMTEHSASEPNISQTEEKRNGSSPKLRTQRYSTIELTTLAIQRKNTTVKTKLIQTLKQNNYNKNFGSSIVASIEKTYEEVQREKSHFSLNKNESKPTQQITKSSLQETERVSSQNITKNALPLKLSSLNIKKRRNIVKTNDILSNTNDKLISSQTLGYIFRKLSPNNKLNIRIKKLSLNDTLHYSIKKITLNNTMHHTMEKLNPNDTLHHRISKPNSNHTLRLSVVKLVSEDRQKSLRT